VLTRPESRDGARPSGRAQENGRSLSAGANAFRGLASRAFRKLPMLPVIILAGVVLSATVDGYASLTNVQNIMRQLSVILIAATGQTLVLLIGGIDLSVGAAIALAAVCGALAMHATASALLGLLTCLAVGAGIGAINGFGVSRVRIQPFIMTFGMLLTARALAFLLTGGMAIGMLPKSVLRLGRLDIAGVPVVFLMGVAVAAVVSIVLSRTVFGQRIYLTGSNMRAAVFSGVNVKRLEFQVYLISGLLAGVSAFVFMIRLGDAPPTAGDPLLLQIIGAVVLGGTSLTGGEGGVLRSASGALLVAMIVKSFEIIGAQFWDQMIVTGVLVALGSALGNWLTRRRMRQSSRDDLATLSDETPAGCQESIESTAG
jgi:ribose transport system permease protein